MGEAALREGREVWEACTGEEEEGSRVSGGLGVHAARARERKSNTHSMEKKGCVRLRFMHEGRSCRVMAQMFSMEMKSSSIF